MEADNLMEILWLNLMLVVWLLVLPQARRQASAAPAGDAPEPGDDVGHVEVGEEAQGEGLHGVAGEGAPVHADSVAQAQGVCQEFCVCCDQAESSPPCTSPRISSLCTVVRPLY